VSVLLGNGDGSFRTKTDWPTGVNSRDVSIGDFDGDGHLDLAVANNYETGVEYVPPGTVSVLLGNGDGSFRPKTDFSAGQLPRHVVVGDVNGDGKQDLVVANQVGPASLLLGNGDGTFQTKRDVDVGTSVLAM